MEVFLGGTCNGSLWRDELISNLNIDYFNPVVENWTEECQLQEVLKRETCDFCLYVLTPKMTGVYSIAEVVDDSNKRPHKTLLCILKEDTDELFNSHQLKSLVQVSKMVESNGGRSFDNLKELSEYLNLFGETIEPTKTTSN